VCVCVCVCVCIHVSFVLNKKVLKTGAKMEKTEGDRNIGK
jgi:hypothetical protein